MTKWVYTFGNGKAEGRATDYERLGGKGANLAEMCRLGLPVPPGLTIVSEACGFYYRNGRNVPEDLKPQVMQGLKQMEAITGRKFAVTDRGLDGLSELIVERDRARPVELHRQGHVVSDLVWDQINSRCIVTSHDRKTECQDKVLTAPRDAGHSR